MIAPVSTLSPSIGALSSSKLGAPGMGTNSLASTPGGSFEATMKDLAGGVIDTLKSAEAAATLGVRGQMPAQDVVQAIMSAEQTLQTAIAVRDKVVAAYLDLTKMAI
jgi:flagellar hook-basal body complex protein FliE